MGVDDCTADCGLCLTDDLFQELHVGSRDLAKDNFAFISHVGVRVGSGDGLKDDRADDLVERCRRGIKTMFQVRPKTLERRKACAFAR